MYAVCPLPFVLFEIVMELNPRRTVMLLAITQRQSAGRLQIETHSLNDVYQIVVSLQLKASLSEIISSTRNVLSLIKLSMFHFLKSLPS